MTFLYRSSPLAGGKIISSAESKKRLLFYVSALSSASYVESIVYLARHIRSDSNLLPADRECLFEYAAYFFRDLTGYDMEDCL